MPRPPSKAWSPNSRNPRHNGIAVSTFNRPPLPPIPRTRWRLGTRFIRAVVECGPGECPRRASYGLTATTACGTTAAVQPIMAGAAIIDTRVRQVCVAEAATPNKTATARPTAPHRLRVFRLRTACAGSVRESRMAVLLPRRKATQAPVRLVGPDTLLRPSATTTGATEIAS